MTTDLKSKNETSDQTEDATRFMNRGEPVKLSFGDYSVKELYVYDLFEILTDCLEVFQSLADLSSEESDDMGFIKQVIKSPQFRGQIGKIFALYCGEEDLTKFEKLKLGDFSKLLVAVKKVTDFEELKSVFFELDLQKYLFPSTATSTETGTPQNLKAK